MVDLINFIGNLNLGTFIVIWTSTIFILIFIFLLLFSVSQMNKETIKISKKSENINRGAFRKIEAWK